MKSIINMIRLKISNFIRKHKDKLTDLGKKLLIVAMGVGIATIILGGLSDVKDNETDNDNITNVYKPTQTVVKGSDVSEEQLEADKNLVNTFLEFCNNKKVDEAYNLVSDECKKEKYPTLEDFKEYYYNDIFEKKRGFNLQAWISNSSYTVYKIRYTNDMLSTGTYDENDVYQDYITLNRKKDTEKISIGSFIDSEECNIVTKTEGIVATVFNKKIYLEDEEYDIYIKNNTDKTILLDDLEGSTNIWLVSGEYKYMPYINKLFVTNFTINPGEVQRITIRFMKNLSSNNISKTIQFSNVIKDYDAYEENKETYTDVTEIKIKVVD